MIAVAKIAFWLLSAIVVYAYAGYGVVLAALVGVRRMAGRVPRPPEVAEIPESRWPKVTFLVAAYNEEDVIPAKIANCREIDYSGDRIEFLFVTDGSTDRTTEILRREPDVRVLHDPARRGKIAAVNRAVPLAKGEIIVFSDANSMFNAESVRYLVRHFADPRVGCVAGEKRVLSLGTTAGRGEGLYWRYESALKRLDADLVSAVGAAGEIFAIRSELYEPPAADTLIEDFVLSLRTAMRGYRIAYEPNAVSLEAPSASVREEFKRRARICAGGWQAIGRLGGLLNPLRHGFLTFAYVSHRVLRWTVVPLSLPLIFIANLILAVRAGSGLYDALMAGQIALYAGALAGWARERRGRHSRVLSVPYYFVMLNVAAWAGLARIVRRRQSVVWDRAQRASSPHDVQTGSIVHR